MSTRPYPRVDMYDPPIPARRPAQTHGSTVSTRGSTTSTRPDFRVDNVAVGPAAYFHLFMRVPQSCLFAQRSNSPALAVTATTFAIPFAPEGENLAHLSSRWCPGGHRAHQGDDDRQETGPIQGGVRWGTEGTSGLTQFPREIYKNRKTMAGVSGSIETAKWQRNCNDDNDDVVDEQRPQF